jgi:phosphomethylpyrimidine synthase
MKITQEVRDFAAKQNSGSYLAATALVERVDAGISDMAEKYRDGEYLYIPAGTDK